MKWASSLFGVSMLAVTTLGGAVASEPDLSSLRYFTGTWHCEDVKAHAHTIVVYSSVLGNTWQQSAGKHGITFYTYDVKQKRFVSIGIGSDGDYETMTSSGWTSDTLTWTIKTDSKGISGSLSIVKVSPTLFNFSQAASIDGKPDSDHGVCAKVA